MSKRLAMILVLAILSGCFSTAIADTTNSRIEGMLEGVSENLISDMVVGYDVETGETFFSSKEEAFQAYLAESKTEDISGISIPASFVDQEVGLDITPHNIYPPDDRQRVTNANVTPYTAIMNVGGHATGFMISRSCLVTAAHVVYDVENKKWKNVINERIYPHINGSLSSSYYQVKKIWISGNYMAGHDIEDDWAMIELSTPTSSSDVPFIMGLTSLYNFDTVYTTAGYPADKQLYTMWYQKAKFCGGGAGTTRLISIDFDVHPGQSGAPVFDATNRAVAVVSHGKHGINYFAYLQPSTVTWLNEHKF